MRILITNDDGIHADGLAALEQIAAQLTDDVWVIAPESDQSGVAHSLSLNDPLRLRKISDKRFAVKGTPTDCVIMAVRHVMAEHRPDLVLSGINRGHNVAEDVTYSGTIAGAMEGTILGIPSIALSQGYPHRDRDAIRYDYAVKEAPALIRRVLEIGIDPGILVNINFPGVEPSEVKGVKVAVQGQRDQTALLNIVKRGDGRGLPYYWLAFNPVQFEPKEGTDLHAVREGYISITPLRLDLTDMPSVTRFAEAFEG
ncbi:MAG TPA: 5'/3'-nucleotidase SurE [Beijerinckiaceae bacterium]|nr:5'/3'-nucleotidase SurE [Beijerinckiaceae bacterium]